jgi:hypothetical protein
MMQHLNSCSTFRFERGVMSCNLRIIIYTPQKLSLVFMTYFLGLHCYPKKCLPTTSLLTPFWEFSLFLFAPYTNVFCSSVQNNVLTTPKKCSAVNWNFKWILKILLSLVCLLELCQESSAFTLHKYSHRVLKQSTIHWRHSQFSETDSWGIGYKYLVQEKVYALHGPKEEGNMILKNTH